MRIRFFFARLRLRIALELLAVSYAKARRAEKYFDKVKLDLLLKEFL